MAAALERVRSMMQGRNFILLLDTATTALTNVVVVIVAARGLDAAQLDAFSLGQLVVVTTVSMMRAALYSPAMAAQRHTGQARIPLSWLWKIGLPLAALVSLGISPFMGLASVSWHRWALVMLLTMLSALAQDGVRSVLVSREQERSALVSDLTVLVVMMMLWLGSRLPASAMGLLLVWAACGLVGLAVGLIFVLRGANATLPPPQSLRATWSLSKWASVDIGMASVATLLPFFVATAALDSNTAGVYRTLQTALGPLNIVHTTVVTAFGLDAWRTASREGLEKLGRQVSRVTVMLTVGGAAYSMLAVLGMIVITGLEHPSLHRISLIMMVTATLGAANSAYNAAALALGYQKSGAVLRSVIVLATVAVSLPWSARTWVPWHDPIGASALTAGVVTFIGWALSYRAGMRAELGRLRGQIRARRAGQEGDDDVAIVTPRRAAM